ncbi:MAG: flagellar protein FlgN [Desulfitobacteriaceae bacterium]
MADQLQNLNDNLKIQARIYAELNELARQKQQALTSNNLHNLEAVTVQEEQLLLEAARLEKERLMWAEQIGLELGKASEDLTLTELAEHYPELREVQIELDNVIMQLRQAHEINTQLLQQALKVVDFTVGLMTQEQATTYNHPGRKEINTASRAHLLDRSV